MRAVQLQHLSSEPVLVEVQTPTPGPGEVLLRVDAAGLCHSDLHLMDLPAQAFPKKDRRGWVQLTRPSHQETLL